MIHRDLKNDGYSSFNAYLYFPQKLAGCQYANWIPTRDYPIGHPDRRHAMQNCMHCRDTTGHPLGPAAKLVFPVFLTNEEPVNDYRPFISRHEICGASLFSQNPDVVFQHIFLCAFAVSGSKILHIVDSLGSPKCNLCGESSVAYINDNGDLTPFCIKHLILDDFLQNHFLDTNPKPELSEKFKSYFGRALDRRFRQRILELALDTVAVEKKEEPKTPTVHHYLMRRSNGESVVVNGRKCTIASTPDEAIEQISKEVLTSMENDRDLSVWLHSPGAKSDYKFQKPDLDKLFPHPWAKKEDMSPDN